jgi:copper(I)-binding protein
LKQHLLTGLVLLSLATGAQGRAADAIRVSGAWSRPAAAGQVAVGYFTVTNTATTPDRLVAVSSPRAEHARIFQSVMVGDIATMPQVKGGLELAPGQAVRFAPGSYHLMFEPLKTAQRLGDTLPVVLTFARAGQVTVKFAVAASPPS